MKKKAISQRGSGSLVPSHLNDMAFFTDSILNPGENVKELFSDKDSSGRELSEGQQKYFKDSTVRDDNGNLKVVYRGDTNKFTVFDRKKTNYSNLYGRGFYFTDSKAHAEQYGEAREFYLDIKNPLLYCNFAVFSSDILYFVQSDIFDKSKVLLKTMSLVVFYSPTNCRRQYHCGAISLAVQIPLAEWRIKLPSVLKNTRHTNEVFCFFAIT